MLSLSKHDADDPRLFRRTFFLLCAIVGVNLVAVDTSVPAIRAMATELGTDLASAQATLGSFLVGVAIGQLMWGTLADRYGRRPTLLIGLTAYVATSFAVAMAPSIEPVIVLRFIQGIGSASAFVLSRAIVRDIFSVSDGARMFASLFQVIGVFPMICPIIGGELTQLLGWRAVYVFIGCFGAMGLVVMALGFRESLAAPDRDALRVDRIVASMGMLLADASYRGYLIIGIGMHVSVFSIVAAMPSVVIGYLGLTPAIFGYLYSIIMAIQLAAAMAGGRLIRRYGAAPLTAAGVTIAGAAALGFLGLGLAGAVSAVTMVIAIGVFMAGFALLNPPMMAGALANFHHMAGRATSLMGFIHQATGALTVFVMGLLIDDTPGPFAAGMVCGGLIIVGAYVFLVRPLNTRHA